MRLVLINPNTTASVTEMMVGIARSVVPETRIDGLTARFGAQLITSASELAMASKAVAELAPSIADRPPDGVILAAFGDPGLSELRSSLRCPVTGIAEASMSEAAESGRFAVVTTTPGLVTSISRLAAAYGHGGLFVGTYLTEGDPVELMADAAALHAGLASACQRALTAGADTIVIGGGPLSLAARALGDELRWPIIEPIPAAVRLACLRAGASL
jgi:allantoin racemase